MCFLSFSGASSAFQSSPSSRTSSYYKLESTRRFIPTKKDLPLTRQWHRGDAESPCSCAQAFRICGQAELWRIYSVHLQVGEWNAEALVKRPWYDLQLGESLWLSTKVNTSKSARQSLQLLQVTGIALAITSVQYPFALKRLREGIRTVFFFCLLWSGLNHLGRHLTRFALRCFPCSSAI